MIFSLRQLRYALAVAGTGHFGRAAALCAVTQPALSQQIQALELLCGTRLFDRTAQGVRITPFGREFVDRARGIVDAADALLEFATARGGAPARPIRFGLIPTVAPYLLPDIFPALRDAFPALAFTISENRTDALLAGLDGGDIDLALIATDPPASGVRLTAEPLFDDAFVLAASAGDTAVEPVSLLDIKPERILLLNEGHCFRDQAIAACFLEGDTEARTFAATSLSTIMEFVANGQGVTLLPEISLRKEATDPRIRICALAAPGAGRRLSLVWREATPFASLFTRIAETIRATRSGNRRAASLKL